MEKKTHTFGSISYEVISAENINSINTFDDILKIETSDNEQKESVVKNIYKLGFTEPTPVQKLAIPYIISGKDLIVQSPSGTGKTGTYIIGTMMSVLPHSNKNKKDKSIGIILANTHTLAKQIYDVFRLLDSNKEYLPTLCVGGLGKDLLPGDRKKLFHKLDEELSKADIIIGTSGRIHEKIMKKKIDSKNIKIFIIDEADKIMNDAIDDDSGNEFMKGIMQSLPAKGECQVVFCSATFDEDILIDMKKQLSENHTTILMSKDNVNLQGIKQCKIDMSNIDAHEDEAKFNTLEDIYRCFPAHRAFIFVNSRERGDKLRVEMTKIGFCVDVLHGGMSNKEQEEKLKLLDKGEITALISTDISGRGIDIQHLNLVINYDLPCNKIEDYIHRIGRCGRYGRKGVAISFVNNRRDERTIRAIEEEYSIKIEDMPDPDKLQNILEDKKSGF